MSAPKSFIEFARRLLVVAAGHVYQVSGRDDARLRTSWTEFSLGQVAAADRALKVDHLVAASIAPAYARKRDGSLILPCFDWSCGRR